MPSFHDFGTDGWLDKCHFFKFNEDVWSRFVFRSKSVQNKRISFDVTRM